YEVLSGTPVSAIQIERATIDKLCTWLREYQDYPVLATISDGEDTIIVALKCTWPKAPHQRCQEHFLGNFAEKPLEHDHE
nr:hypothetical protein [Chloroflexota bacterium]